MSSILCAFYLQCSSNLLLAIVISLNLTNNEFYVMCYYYYFIIAVFIYSCPGFKCSIKERTVYSSCKNTLSSAIENDIGIEVAKKVTSLVHVIL